MRLQMLVGLLSAVMLAGGCKNDTSKSGSARTDDSSKATSTKVVNQVVDASCGECQLGMEGSSCDLAVLIEGKSYFVDGTTIDEHGDPHSEDGMCNCIRQAKVTGEIRDGRFSPTSFELLPRNQEK